jgi:hypothetical protein
MSGVSVIDLIREEARQARTGDLNYYQRLPYAWVLRGPPFKGPLGPSGVAVFPMVVPPEELGIKWPFAATVTPLGEQGVAADEGGIVIAELAVSATTGFRLRKNYDTSWGAGDGEFSGLLGQGGGFLEELSGQMAFWRLANRCFDAYSALKKDPTSASQTMLEFHSIKDDYHYLVVPMEFALTRNASKDRVTYRYSVRCEIIGSADAEVYIPSPDVGLLQSIQNAIQTIRDTVQGIKAAIDDVTAALDEIRRTITNAANIIRDVGDIVDAFSDLVDGVTKFAAIPSAFLTAVAEDVESAAALAATIEHFPASVAQTFRNIADGCDALKVAGRGKFEEDYAERARLYDRLAEGPRLGKDPARDAAAAALRSEATSAGTTSTVARVFGAVKPGDPVRAALLGQKSGRFRFANGFQSRVVGQGDTLTSLAAKYLKDPHRWPEIVIYNRLRSPYMAAAKQPGALFVGDSVLIPIADPAGQIPALAPAPTKQADVDRYLGTDFELIQISGTKTWGWEIDVAGGSTDVQHVSGLANVVQAVGARFRTERRHNVLYPSIGLPRIVGTQGFGSSVVQAQYESRQQLLADLRISRVIKFGFTTVDDAVTLNATVMVRGSDTEQPLSTTVG